MKKNTEQVISVNANNPVDAIENLPTFDNLVSREIKKFDLVTPAIEELKKEFLPLVVKDLEDKEGYEKVYKAYRVMVSKRTAVEDKRKELKEDSVKFGKAVDARAKEITAMLAPIELHLKTEKERIDSEKEKIRLEEELRIRKLINDRHIELYNLGMNKGVNGTTYIITSQYDGSKVESIPAINLEIMNDEMWGFIINKIKSFNKEENDIKLAKEKEKQEEDERMALERKRLLEEQAKIDAERKAIALQKEEFKSQRFELRIMQLKENGVYLNYNDLTKKQEICYNGYSLVTKDDIYELDNDAFASSKNLIIEKINSIIQANQEYANSILIAAENKKREAQEKAEQEQKEAQERIERDSNELISLVEQQAVKYQKESQEQPNKEQLAVKVGEPTNNVLSEEYNQNSLYLYQNNPFAVNINSADEDKYNDYISKVKSIQVPELVNKKYLNNISLILNYIDSLEN